jgi:hypothetical protein
MAEEFNRQAHENHMQQLQLTEQLKQKAAKAEADADRAALHDWVASVERNLAPGQDDVRTWLLAPDFVAKDWRLSSTLAGVRLTEMSDPEPAGALGSTSVAEARSEALSSRRRARAATDVPRWARTEAYNKFAKDTSKSR